MIESICAKWIIAMPVSKSHVLLSTVLFVAMFVAHSLPASFEKSVDSATCHRLVTMPVSRLNAWSHPVCHIHLAVQSFSQRESVFFTRPRKIPRVHYYWTCFFLLVYAARSKKWISLIIIKIYNNRLIISNLSVIYITPIR